MPCPLPMISWIPAFGLEGIGESIIAVYIVDYEEHTTADSADDNVCLERPLLRANDTLLGRPQT